MSRRERLLGDVVIASSRGLEIGALNAPLVRKSEGWIQYVDYADTEIVRANRTSPNIDPSSIVDVDIVWGGRPLIEAVGEPVDYVIASHVIEHVPDLVAWLADIRGVLRPGGTLGLIVPDRRYTFDLLRRETTIAKVVAAWLRGDRQPPIETIFECLVMSVEVDARVAWQEDLLARDWQPLIRERLTDATAFVRDLQAHQRYVDVHCWVFTPLSFLDLADQLNVLGFFPFRIADFYPTEPDSLEFSVRLVAAGAEDSEMIGESIAHARAMAGSRESSRPQSAPEIPAIPAIAAPDVTQAAPGVITARDAGPSDATDAESARRSMRSPTGFVHALARRTGRFWPARTGAAGQQDSTTRRTQPEPPVVPRPPVSGGTFTAHNVRLDDGSETLPEMGQTMDQHPLVHSVARTLGVVFPSGLYGRSLVDIGCLEGGFTSAFARLGLRATGIEVRESNFRNCLFVKSRLDLPWLDFIRDDANNIANHGPFDVAFVNGLLYHLDHPRRFLTDLAKVCRKVLFLQTHVARAEPSEAVQLYGLSELTENEGLKGRWYPEYGELTPEQLDQAKWASWSNNRSFWVQKEYLIDLLRQLGFGVVVEQFDWMGNVIHEMTEGSYRTQDRVLLVGIRTDG